MGVCNSKRDDCAAAAAVSEPGSMRTPIPRPKLRRQRACSSRPYFDTDYTDPMNHVVDVRRCNGLVVIGENAETIQLNQLRI